MRQIPVCEPVLGREELKNVADCLKTNWISSKGKYIQEFEKGFAKFCNAKYAIATTSGTTALHLALASLGISKGDEVILPTFTMAATVFSVLYTQAKPVLADIELDTFNINPAEIEKKITKRTKAILIVHLYGHPCEMGPIMDIAKNNKLFLIEDAAESHGAEHMGRKVGTFGDISAFSFYANKIITTGEGGMVVTNNKTLAKRAKILKDMAFDPEKRFLHLETGFNYRMTNIQAAIGLAQLKKINDYINRRRHNAFLYNQLLENIAGIVLPTERLRSKNVYWMYAILLNKKFGFSRDELRKHLMQRGIETRDFFIPMHRQPFFKKLGISSIRESFPIADDISSRGLYLPSGTGLKVNDIQYIAKQIKALHKLVKNENYAY